MKATTPIAIMVEAMLAAGAVHETIVAAVEAQERGAKRRPQQQQLALIEDAKPPNRAARLPEAWQPAQQDVDYARARGLSDAAINREAERFRNYWLAKSGAQARKHSWEATWRNWILKATDNDYARNHNRSGPGGHPAAGRAPTASDAILAGMGRVASRISETRTSTGQERQTSRGTDIAHCDAIDR
jgi:hypothetical protein